MFNVICLLHVSLIYNVTGEIVDFICDYIGRSPTGNVRLHIVDEMGKEKIWINCHSDVEIFSVYPHSIVVVNGEDNGQS